LVPVNITNFSFGSHKKVTCFGLYKKIEHAVLTPVKLKFV